MEVGLRAVSRLLGGSRNKHFSDKPAQRAIPQLNALPSAAHRSDLCCST